MIQSTSPVPASAKWLRISGGRILDPGSRACCMPPRATQSDSRTKPPAAVRSHAMSAIHSMVPPRLWGSRSLCPLRPVFSHANAEASLAMPPESSSLTAPAVRDREAPVAPERLRAQLHTGWRLAALVLRAVDHRERPVHDLGIEPVPGQVLARLVELDVFLEHPVELRIRRQRILVELAGTKLRARGALDNRPRNQLAPRPLVQVPGQAEHVGLVHVLEKCESTGHVAVERGVADRELGLVPRRDDEPAELVRERHQQHGTDTRLEVFLRQVRLAAAEGLRERLEEALDERLDRKLEEVGAERLRKQPRIAARPLRAELRRHRHALHPLRPER